MDKLWHALIIFFTVVSAVVFNKIYYYQTHPHFEKQRKGSFQQIVYFAIPIALAFILLDRLIHKTFDRLILKYFIVEQKYPDLAARIQRSYMVVKWCYSFVYYSISAIWSYYILVNTNILPTWLGGYGTPYNLYPNRFKIIGPIFNMSCFYMMSLGKHLGRMLTHLFIKEEGPFYETAFHHGVSVLLIMISYLTNQWIIGIFVLFVHDTSDGFYLLARIYKDSKDYSRTILAVLGGQALLLWIFLRVIVFSLCCWIPALDALYRFTQDTSPEAEIEKQVALPFLMLTGMLIALQILQVFWSYYLGKASLKVIFGDKSDKKTSE